MPNRASHDFCLANSFSIYHFLGAKAEMQINLFNYNQEGGKDKA